MIPFKPFHNLMSGLFKRILLPILGCFVIQCVDAQVFSPEDFIQQVKQFHPVIRQAGLLERKANAELQIAKGGFDPTLTYENYQKTFDGKNYYLYTNPEIKIPTSIAGLDVKSGLENNGGFNLNPETSAGKNSYLGVEIALGKGLLLDKRRATVQQAKIFQQQSLQEQQKSSTICSLWPTTPIGNGRDTINYNRFTTAIIQFLQIDYDG